MKYNTYMNETIFTWKNDSISHFFKLLKKRSSVGVYYDSFLREAQAEISWRCKDIAVHSLYKESNFDTVGINFF